jgi:hypothetical protein
MLVSLMDVPITAYELTAYVQENNAKILIICPLLELSISNFFIHLLCRMDKGLVILFAIPVSCDLLFWGASEGVGVGATFQDTVSHISNQ